MPPNGAFNNREPETFVPRANFMPDIPTDPCPLVSGVESRVCLDIATRQAVGIRKYGTTLEGNPAGRVGRIRHAYQEALDLALYLKWELEKAEEEERQLEAKNNG